MEKSPLLVGQKTGTDLDLVTSRLLFTFPLNDEQIQWLNTVIYQDSVFYINYWSLTHTLFGLCWGVLYLWKPSMFSVWRYVVLQTLFEIWELWAGGYLSGISELTVPEIVDGIMDTLFGLLGVWLMIVFFG